MAGRGMTLTQILQDMRFHCDANPEPQIEVQIDLSRVDFSHVIWHYASKTKIAQFCHACLLLLKIMTSCSKIIFKEHSIHFVSAPILLSSLSIENASSFSGELRSIPDR
jgi:hypothetical protein